MGRQIDQQIDVVGGNSLGSLPFRKMRERDEMVGEIAESRRPVIVHRAKVVEKELEARAVMMLHRLPDHLAHHVITQIRREIADA